MKPKSSLKAQVRGWADACPAGAFDPHHRAVRWEKDKSLLLRQAKRPRQQSCSEKTEKSPRELGQSGNPPITLLFSHSRSSSLTPRNKHVWRNWE